MLNPALRVRWEIGVCISNLEQGGEMKKQLLAAWGTICPFCNIARKYPDSSIGKKVRKHWEEGCPVNEAYNEVIKTKRSNMKTP